MRKKQNNDVLMLGIDLGTTFSSIGMYRNGSFDVFKDNWLNDSIPSVVAFTKDEILVGETAIQSMLTSPQMLDCVYDSKRMIGRTYNKISKIRESSQMQPYKVINVNGYPKYQVNYQNEYYSPEEISSIILKELMSIAKGPLSNKKVTGVVIAVPADFDEHQREATKMAGKLAGLNVVKILDEPVAAAISYGIHEKYSSPKNILVFDFGGGTLDVSILRVHQNEFDVLASEGDQNLGGQDIDYNLMKYVVKKFKKRYGYDPLTSPCIKLQFKRACEKAKIILSKLLETTINPQVVGKPEFCCKIARTKFEEIKYEIFDQILTPVKKVIQSSNLQKSEIDDIILIGGTSNIPAVQDKLNHFFGKNPIVGIDLTLAVVQGASIKATDISQEGGGIIKYHPVMPHDIGVEENNCKMNVLIKKNTKLPANNSRVYSPISPQQRRVTIKVFMGDDILTANNVLLGEIKINFNESNPDIAVKFEVNEEGMLNVTAGETSKGNIKYMKVDNVMLYRENKVHNDKVNTKRNVRKLIMDFVTGKSDFVVYFCTMAVLILGFIISLLF
ncbi:cytoplasmic heat shock protein 70 [Histomonas meleagridis]|uniref:cytoplasmic heat shock protein 70 n=1 Tax=Histomonas meleagridis TaxID=135588 RepID=UPI003559BBF4|nr:cytoplasmic heat shock protein 70 [Histomonas meleagridis]KAH0806390.1 cytoplasmic heat shock protein 70 [Histomonas meleagridis]